MSEVWPMKNRRPITKSGEKLLASGKRDDIRAAGLWGEFLRRKAAEKKKKRNGHHKPTTESWQFGLSRLVSTPDTKGAVAMKTFKRGASRSSDLAIVDAVIRLLDALPADRRSRVLHATQILVSE